jgi:hypothetical protein
MGNGLLQIVVRLWPIHQHKRYIHLHCDHRTQLRSIASMHKNQPTSITLLIQRTQLITFNVGHISVDPAVPESALRGSVLTAYSEDTQSPSSQCYR